jgi:type II secretory pathway component PulK
LFAITAARPLSLVPTAAEAGAFVARSSVVGEIVYDVVIGVIAAAAKEALSKTGHYLRLKGQVVGEGQRVRVTTYRVLGH